MAKTRAQRKAERRAREARDRRDEQNVGTDAEAQRDTQVPVSGEVAEAEAVEVGIAAGAPESQLETPDAPKPTRAERRAEQKRQREQEKKRESQQVARKQKGAVEERSRGAVAGFIASCWAELKKVQWPDRDTLVQATAVTVIFVAIAAAYLGALDAAFNWLVQRLL